MADPTPKELAAAFRAASFHTLQTLAADGHTRHRVSRHIDAGRLIRLRKGRYARAGTSAKLVEAGRLGGRLDCLSLLSALGIFVHTGGGLHIQMEAGSSRVPPLPKNAVRHWRTSGCSARQLAADLTEALAQSFRCQGLREAIATLDSALHHDVVDEEGISAVFALLPARYQPLRKILDRRAESGPETLMRLILRGLGCHIDVQVWIDGVGRVDFVVDGWLIVECDSKAHHEGWDKQREDRRRDLAAAGLGYSTVRPLAEDILYHPERVIATLRAALSTPPMPRRAPQDSSDPHAESPTAA